MDSVRQARAVWFELLDLIGGQNDCGLSCSQNMSDEEFEHHRAALISCKLQKPHNLGEASAQMWEPILNQRYEFGNRFHVAQELERLTKGDVQVSIANLRKLKAA